MSHHRSNGSSIRKSRKYSSSYYKHLPENRKESSNLGQSSGSDDTTESLSELSDSEVAADDSPQPQHRKPHQSDPNAQQKHGRLSARRTAAHRQPSGAARGVVQRSLETTQETHSASVETHRSNEGAREASLTKNSRKESRRVVKETWLPSHTKSHGRTISVCSKHPLYKPDKAEKEKKEQYMVVFAPGGRFIRKPVCGDWRRVAADRACPCPCRAWAGRAGAESGWRRRLLKAWSRQGRGWSSAPFHSTSHSSASSSSSSSTSCECPCTNRLKPFRLCSCAGLGQREPHGAPEAAPPPARSPSPSSASPSLSFETSPSTTTTSSSTTPPRDWPMLRDAPPFPDVVLDQQPPGRRGPAPQEPRALRGPGSLRHYSTSSEPSLLRGSPAMPWSSSMTGTPVTSARRRMPSAPWQPARHRDTPDPRSFEEVLPPALRSPGASGGGGGGAPPAPAAPAAACPPPDDGTRRPAPAPADEGSVTDSATSSSSSASSESSSASSPTEPESGGSLPPESPLKWTPEGLRAPPSSQVPECPSKWTPVSESPSKWITEGLRQPQSALPSESPSKWTTDSFRPPPSSLLPESPSKWTTEGLRQPAGSLPPESPSKWTIESHRPPPSSLLPETPPWSTEIIRPPQSTVAPVPPKWPTEIIRTPQSKVHLDMIPRRPTEIPTLPKSMLPPDVPLKRPIEISLWPPASASASEEIGKPPAWPMEYVPLPPQSSARPAPSLLRRPSETAPERSGPRRLSPNSTPGASKHSGKFGASDSTTSSSLREPFKTSSPSAPSKTRHKKRKSSSRASTRPKDRRAPSLHAASDARYSVSSAPSCGGVPVEKEASHEEIQRGLRGAEGGLRMTVTAGGGGGCRALALALRHLVVDVSGRVVVGGGGGGGGWGEAPGRGALRPCPAAGRKACDSEALRRELLQYASLAERAPRLWPRLFVLLLVAQLAALLYVHGGDSLFGPRAF